MRAITSCSVIGVAVPLSLLLASVASVDEEEKAGQIDAKAKQTIRHMCDYLASFKSARSKCRSTMKMEAEGMNTSMDSLFDIAMERPNRFAIRLEQGMTGMTMVSNGKKLYTYMPMMKRYTEQDAPNTIDSTEDLGTMGAGMMMGGGGQMFVMHFLATQPYDLVMEGVEGGEYLGTEPIDGNECHHLRFSQHEMDWDIWLDVGKKPLPRKIVPDMTKAMKQAAEAMGKGGGPAFMKNMKISVTVTFSDWEINPTLQDDVFQFEPPENAEKVDSLFGGFTDKKPHKLVGEPAPATTLKLLDGESVDLQKHRGKQIVILDFWATWCGPCVQTMPTLDKIAQDYKDKDVVFYAVNQQESTSRPGPRWQNQQVLPG